MCSNLNKISSICFWDPHARIGYGEWPILDVIGSQSWRQYWSPSWRYFSNPSWRWWSAHLGWSRLSRGQGSASAFCHPDTALRFPLWPNLTRAAIHFAILCVWLELCFTIHLGHSNNLTCSICTDCVLERASFAILVQKWLSLGPLIF